MDDNSNIAYYLVLGAIYLLSKIFGKKKKKPGAPEPAKKRNIAPPTAEGDGDKAISFEEILRELSGAANPKPEPESKPIAEAEVIEEQEPAYVDVPQSIQPGSYSTDEIDEIAVDYEAPEPIGDNKYSDSMSQPIERKKLTFERSKKFKIVKEETIDFLEGLNDINGPAKAFVMSEIFTRKYE